MSPDQSPPVKEGIGTRLLIVDDEPNIVRLMVVYLHPYGYEIHTASNGQEALEKIRLLRPDLLITDQMMPVMNGVALTAAIRADNSLSTLPVIMLEARAPDNLRPRSSHGANYVLTKPFDPRELHPLVMNVLQKSQAEPLHETVDTNSSVATRRILIANDIPHITKIIEKYLGQEGYEVEASDEQQAVLNRLHTAPPDLLIIGWEMTAIDGDALLDTVRADLQMKDLPIIRLIARPSDYEPELKAGADFYLDMPFNPRDLTGTVAQLIAQRAAQDK